MIDIIITGSSRPDLLKITIEKFRKFLFTERKIRWLLHEDFVWHEQSKESISVANSLGIDVILKHSPACGLGISIDTLLQKVETPYVIYLQDDWELERPVELDRLLWTMDRHDEINHILFPPHKIEKERGGGDFIRETYNFDGLDLTLNNGWYLNPAIWRMSKVKEKWERNPERIEGFFINRFGTHEQRLNHDFLRKNLGSYFLGKIDDYRYVRHLGSTFRNENFRLEDSNLAFEVYAYKHMAPWLSYKKRPLNRKIQPKFSHKEEVYYQEVKDLPEDVRKHILGG